jgi:hypothetical protein
MLLAPYSCRGEPSRIESGVHRQSPSSVQAKIDGQQRRDPCARTGRRRFPQVQSQSFLLLNISTTPLRPAPRSRPLSSAVRERLTSSSFFRCRDQTSVGSVHYAPEKSAFVWKIKQLAGGKDYLMRAHFGLPSVKTGTSSSLALPLIFPFFRALVSRFSLSTPFTRPFISLSPPTHLLTPHYDLLPFISPRLSLSTPLRRSPRPNPNLRQVRDPLLHRLRHPSPLSQDRREVWLSSSSLGPIHHPARR